MTALIAIACATSLIEASCTCPAAAPLTKTSPTTKRMASHVTDRTVLRCLSTAHLSIASVTVFELFWQLWNLSSSPISKQLRLSSSSLSIIETNSLLHRVNLLAELSCQYPSHLGLSSPLLTHGQYSPYSISVQEGFQIFLYQSRKNAIHLSAITFASTNSALNLRVEEKSQICNSHGQIEFFCTCRMH